MAEEKIKAIEEIEATTTKPVDQEIEIEKRPTERVATNKEQFDTLMREEKIAAPKDASKTSLMDAVRDMNYSEKKEQASQSNLINQTKEAIGKIDEIKAVLENPNVQVKRSAHQLLNNKLSHIDESLRIALSKAGLDYTPEVNPEVKTGKNPIEKFLFLLTDGQWQLAKLSEELTTMGKSNRELSPVNMLAIQVKVGQIQQELELFSSLLNKGLESIKTIMNIQV